MTYTLSIEVGIEPEYERALQRAALLEGWCVQVVQNVPFTDQFLDNKHVKLTDEFLQNPNVWFHGSIQAAKRAQAVTRWQVHAQWDKLCCSSYYPLISERLLQKEHLFMSMAAFSQRHDELFNSPLVEDESLFIRPDGNDKTFTGGCIAKNNFTEDYALMTFYDPPPETVVVVARPQRIFAEARFLIVDGKVVAGSFYKSGGQSVRLEAYASLMEIASENLRFCLSRGFNPSPSWVLDLAQTKEGWYIIEVGASSACGLYKCDLTQFMKALTVTMEKQ